MAANFGDTINVNALLSSPSVDASEQEDTTRPFSMVRPSFFIFCFTDFFRNKLLSEDEIKIKFIQTIFQLN